MALRIKLPPAQDGLGRSDRLAVALSEAVEAGKFDGQPLPSVRELEAATGFSKQTIKRAVDQLVARGMVRREPGIGTFPVRKDAA